MVSTFSDIVPKQEAVQRPFEAGQAEGRARLMALLRRTMIRASKSAITSIPPCTKTVRHAEAGLSPVSLSFVMHHESRYCAFAAAAVVLCFMPSLSAALV